MAALVIAAIAYESLIVALLYNELMASSLRATDRVLILLGLLFFPYLLVLMGRFVGGLQLKLPGSLELIITGLERQVKETKQRQTELEEQLDGKLSTAELTLYPLIGGPNVFAKERLSRSRLIIGSKDFAANIVAAELLAQHVESYGIECERRIPNGGTVTNYACLINGWVDLIVDYTGTGCLFFNIDHHGKSRDEILQILNRISKERYGMAWLAPLGTKTNYCLVVNPNSKYGNNLERISDLETWKRDELRFCGNYEFLNRRDGLLGLKQSYNLRFKREIPCSYRERYALVRAGDADVTVGHTTDPQIGDLDLKILEDDKEFFPDYYEVPIVRDEALDLVKNLRSAISDLVTLKIDNQDIMTLIQDYEKNTDSLTRTARDMLKRKRGGLKSSAPTNPAAS